MEKFIMTMIVSFLRKRNYTFKIERKTKSTFNPNIVKYELYELTEDGKEIASSEKL